MKNLKNFKMFLESYSDDLEEVLSNPENLFIVLKGEEILVGFEFLSDAYDYISDILESDGAISEEQKYEFQDYFYDSNLGEDSDQFEIDDLTKELLDKFEVIEPYKVKLRSELEETPIDSSFDDEEDSEEELEDFLSESNISDIDENVYIVGIKNGKKTKLDSFLSKKEAESFLPDYKVVHKNYDELSIEGEDVSEN